jgi:hypothetical protein
MKRNYDFEKGDGVQVELGGIWVDAVVLSYTETRVSIRLLTPVLFIEKTRVIKKRYLFAQDKVEESVTEKYVTSLTVGNSFVRKIN